MGAESKLYFRCCVFRNYSVISRKIVPSAITFTCQGKARENKRQKGVVAILVLAEAPKLSLTTGRVPDEILVLKKP